MRASREAVQKAQVYLLSFKYLATVTDGLYYLHKKLVPNHFYFNLLCHRWILSQITSITINIDDYSVSRLQSIHFMLILLHIRLE